MIPADLLDLFRVSLGFLVIFGVVPWLVALNSPGDDEAEFSTSVGQAILPAAAFKAALDSCCGALRRRLKPTAATIGCPTNLAQLFPDIYSRCNNRYSPASAHSMVAWPQWSVGVLLTSHFEYRR